MITLHLGNTKKNTMCSKDDSIFTFISVWAKGHSTQFWVSQFYMWLIIAFNLAMDCPHGKASHGRKTQDLNPVPWSFKIKEEVGHPPWQSVVRQRRSRWAVASRSPGRSSLLDPGVPGKEPAELPSCALATYNRSYQAATFSVGWFSKLPWNIYFTLTIMKTIVSMINHH